MSLDQQCWLVVGLGNPGGRYATTRHNLGALVISDFVETHGQRFTSRAKLKASLADFRVAEHRCIAAIPDTYMNESGFAVRKLRNFFKIKDDNVIVIHDELDLPFGRTRIKYGGGDNGHNGVISVHENLTTPDFLRLRMGIGRPSGSMPPAEYVLSHFSKKEMAQLPEVTNLGAQAIDSVIVEGLEMAQTRFNGVA